MFLFLNFQNDGEITDPNGFYICPSKFISCISKNPSAELVEIATEIKIHNVQIIAKDFSGCN